MTTDFCDTAAPTARAAMLGPLELVLAPTLAVFTADEAKLHCRMDQAFEDQLVTRWVAAATRHVQRLTGRQLLTAHYDLPLAGWWSGLLKLPKAPLQSVTTLKYYDTDEVLTTVTAAEYIVKTPADQPGYVELHPDDFDRPGVHSRRYPVVLRFVCGWASAALIPESFQQAILLLVGHWYRNRETVLTGTISKEVEFAVTSLLDAEEMGRYS